jgi:DNA polymerase elongation subunit (family B)
MRVRTDLLKLYDWYYKNRPIAAGHGTFFYNQDIRSSPIQNVIDGRIGARKDYQKIRDTYIGPGGDTTSYEYQYYEMMQMEAKVKINAIYGAFGAKTFQLYNIYTASSTTGTAQSLISTTAMAFEAFLNNAVKFKSLGELVNLVTNVLVKDERKLSIDGLKPVRDPEIVFNLWKSQFLEWKPEYEPTMRNILRHRDVEDLTRLYYINNLFALVENDIIMSRLVRIYNVTTQFRNPNEIPENIKEDLEFIWDYCREFVFYNHAYTEQIDRLKHDPRSRVILIDTDSNVINIKPWVDWTQQHVWIRSTSAMDENDMRFCSVNILAYLVTRMARELLDRYADDCNVLPRFHKRLNTKNEFYFPKVLLANVKKRYIADIKLREGKQVSKIELKGHDFKKAGVNANIESELMGIIKKDIINDPLVNVVGLMRDVSQLESKIRKSIEDRERTYLVRMNCKVGRSYKDPYSQGAFTGPLLWNLINPDNVIMVPDKCDVVFLNIPNEKVLDEKLAPKFPREAEIIRKNIFHGGVPQFENKGVSYLALPNDNSKIPEWVYPVIDTERIVTRNSGTFYPVLKALTFVTIKAGDNEYSSNILNV